MYPNVPNPKVKVEISSETCNLRENDSISLRESTENSSCQKLSAPDWTCDTPHDVSSKEAQDH